MRTNAWWVITWDKKGGGGGKEVAYTSLLNRQQAFIYNGYIRTSVYKLRCIEILNVKPGVKRAIILLLGLVHIKVLKDAPAC